MLACVSVSGWAQEEGSVTGKVVDRQGNPVEGALVSIEDNSQTLTTTDRNGIFTISALKDDMLRIQSGRGDTKVMPVGDKKNEITPEDRKKIAHLYADFVENENCKIYKNEEFIYRKYTVMQPLQRSYAITEERIEAML